MTHLPLIFAVASAVSLAASGNLLHSAVSCDVGAPICTDGVHRGVQFDRPQAVHRGITDAALCDIASDPTCGLGDGVHRGLQIEAPNAVHRGVALACDATDPLCGTDDGVHRGLGYSPFTVATACDVTSDPTCDDGVHRG